MTAGAPATPGRASAARGEARQRSDRVLRALSEAGFSDTRARRAVVTALCETHRGATPADLLARGRRRHAALGQVTVYRPLEILEGLGLARKLHQEDGCSSYAVASRGHAHHVICRSCRAAVEFEGCRIDDVLKEVSARTGYKVESHFLELFGLCPRCRGKK